MNVHARTISFFLPKVMLKVVQIVYYHFRTQQMTTGRRSKGSLNTLLLRLRLQNLSFSSLKRQASVPVINLLLLLLVSFPQAFVLRLHVVSCTPQNGDLLLALVILPHR